LPMGLEAGFETKAVAAAHQRRSRPRLKRLSAFLRVIDERFTL
jgi:hypothetical protein